MKVETELDAGGAGFFLVDNEVTLQNIVEVRVTQAARYAGSLPGDPQVEYGLENRGEGMTWVPEKRAAKTKEALLKKL